MQAGIEQEAYRQTFWGGTEIFRHALVVVTCRALEHPGASVPHLSAQRQSINGLGQLGA